VEVWRVEHRRQKDEAWSLILRLCESRSRQDELDDLQTLNDSAFDVMEAMWSAYYSLEEMIDAYDKMSSIKSGASYADEIEVISSMKDDLDSRSRLLVDYYSKVLSSLFS
jgi:hypothetical protein